MSETISFREVKLEGGWLMVKPEREDLGKAMSIVRKHKDRLYDLEQILQALRSAGLSSVGVDTPDNSSLIVSARIESSTAESWKCSFTPEVRKITL